MAYPHNLGEILVLMGHHPSEFEVADNLDGEGPYFVRWDPDGPQPTEEDIDDFYTSYLAYLPEKEFVELKESTKRTVDAIAESTRKSHITSIVGQDMVYLRKENEAVAYKAADYPNIKDSSEYPHIHADSVAYGITPQEAADRIITKRDEWLIVSAEIERERLSGKNAVDAAADEDEVNAALDEALGALNALRM